MTVSTSFPAVLGQKQEALDFQDLQGLLRLEWKIGDISLFSGFYTRIDQVFILWGLICAGIFCTAQFLPISWYQQAIGWSVLTAIATIVMVMLTWFWVCVERLRWLVYGWVGLMCGGVAITDMGIFLGWGTVLMYLCPLWLGLTAIGYLLTAWGVRSRAFLLMAAIHLNGIFLLPYCGGWQFLVTGLIMGISLLALAQLQWDMRSPIDYDFLTPEQKLFNQQQHQQRQVEVEN
ncbi:MAG: hypothetical protein QNJ51_19305 [Calothrix sp. MO_167.B12]|nr:hypothetical protein [Calothrix sp. MO_167.B12]